ncbi:MAG TPA: SRPBCC family protein [Steroidobacteraceae bacterium]|nr:SRPBCC family protein [Steroidobacteraceae bacterium]
MATRLLPAITALTVGTAAAGTAGATVADVAANGFTVQFTTHIASSPDQVYRTLVRPSLWWASDHTFSGNAANLSLDAKGGGCWCERLPHGGWVMHLTVVYADPGKALRLRGALGPFQGMAVDGALTFALKPGHDGTDMSMTYTLGGYSKDGFEALSKAADDVLGSQLQRLKLAMETGSPESRESRPH